jgi:aminoglycoside phosphotransferase (APT) family kinase protein
MNCYLSCQVMTTSIESLLQIAMLRHLGAGEVTDCARLTGGATMESWRFEFAGETYVLRRAPTLEFMADRPFGHDTEAAIIRAAHAAGVTAPDVVTELTPEDGLGSGFVMRALPGTPDPRAILAMVKPGRILEQAARDLARIHALGPDQVPSDVPTLDYAESIAGLRGQFDEAGGDRPIIALGLKWLTDNMPAPVDPVLNHGDFRLGNILAEDSYLTGVLDWELAHFGDRHEDLAFGCMAVWRFARYDRPAMGLGSLEDYFAAYETESGTTVDRDRFRFWMIFRTVWWALGCLRMAKFWRSGEDRMLERVVISRRTSEQELDLLMLLSEEVPDAGIEAPRTDPQELPTDGEASNGEIATAISEWLATMKDKVEGHERFQLAVARNALGMIARDDAISPRNRDAQLSDAILRGKKGLNSEGLLAKLKRDALDKLSADIPKYPALAVARKKWTGED